MDILKRYHGFEMVGEKHSNIISVIGVVTISRRHGSITPFNLTGNNQMRQMGEPTLISGWVAVILD